MRTHALAMAAAVASLTATAAPAPAAAQGMGLGSLFKCDNGNGKTGAIVGGLAGALAGSQVSKNERTLGALVGAGLGAWAGNQVACRMNASGRDRAETAFERALNTGRTQTWSDPRTGASGRVEVVSGGFDSRHAAYAGEYSQPVSATDLRYGRGIQRVNGLRPAAPVYESPGRVNVRAAPGMNAPVVDRLSAGQQIRTAGMTRDGWLAVEEDGWVQGYVSASALRPVPAVTYVRNMDSPYECRIVQQTISQRGYPGETQRFNACRDTAGEWRLEPL